MTVNRDSVELCCERLDSGGRGVAHRGDVAVSAENWLPGERAVLEIEHTSPHRALAWARVLERRGPRSPDRVEPACPGFGRCGGCRLQHLCAPAQLELKRRRVREALDAAGLGAVEVAEVVAAPAALGYRNKGKYVFGRDEHGQLVLGAYRPRTHEVASTLGCRVVDPAIDRCAVALTAAAAASGLAIYDERSGAGALRYAIIRAGVDGRVVAALITRSGVAPEAIADIAAAIVGRAAAGMVWATNDRDDGALLDGPALAVAGDAEVAERSGGLELRLPVTAFAQINRDQAARLIERLAARLDPAPRSRVLDAYAGAGAIAFALAARGCQVTAVEIDAAAVEAGRQAASGLDIDFIRGDAAAALARAVDIAVVNPPRKGLSADARAALIASGTPRIAYVSCGPESLARDLAALAAAGYAIETVEPFDLMPGTPEIESLAIARKRLR